MITEKELQDLELLEEMIHPAPWVESKPEDFKWDDGSLSETDYQHHLWAVRSRNAFKSILQELREHRNGLANQQ